MLNKKSKNWNRRKAKQRICFFLAEVTHNHMQFCPNRLNPSLKLASFLWILKTKTTEMRKTRTILKMTKMKTPHPVNNKTQALPVTGMGSLPKKTILLTNHSLKQSLFRLRSNHLFLRSNSHLLRLRNNHQSLQAHRISRLINRMRRGKLMQTSKKKWNKTIPMIMKMMMNDKYIVIDIKIQVNSFHN